MKKNKTVQDHKQQLKSRRLYWPWAALLVIILFTSAIRARLLEAPLERDEGEYAYAGQLILQGIAPYDQVYSMKMPGIYAAYAVILAVFGQTHLAVHLGLLIINAVTIILLFLLARRLFNPLTGIAAAAAFGLLSLGQFVQGIFANAEHFVLPFALGGILLLQRALDTQKIRPLLTGAILLGTGFLMKQHGAAFIIFAGLYLIFSQSRRRPFTWKLLVFSIIFFGIGAILPFAVTCGLLFWAGTFDNFWFWTISYAREYTSSVPINEGFEKYFYTYIKEIINAAVLLWVLAGIGLTSLLWNKNNRRHWVFVIGFFLLSFLALCPGFYFRPHYFNLLMPAVALLVGIGAGATQELFTHYRSLLMTRALPLLMASVILLQAFYQQRNFLFKMTPTEASRTIYRGNPFAESLEIARVIKERSLPEDRIAILGSEPQIFFYAHRRSASSYIYTYEMVRNHSYAPTMQQEMIRQIETARPKFLIFVRIGISWLVKEGADEMIFEWFEKYQQENYQRIGVIDIYPFPKQSQFRWDQDAVGYSPRSPSWLAVYQRNT